VIYADGNTPGFRHMWSVGLSYRGGASTTPSGIPAPTQGAGTTRGVPIFDAADQ
jgi:hypothetical protein